MTTKESIDAYFSENDQFVQRIKRISENYSVADFVKVTESIRAYLQKESPAKVDTISGCIYNIRKGYLRLNIESVESRLTNEYLDYLLDVLKIKGDVDVVFYIVAYHYLSLVKQLGYCLTGDNNSNASFHFFGEEMSVSAKKNYERLHEMYNGRLYSILNYINEDDLIYYNKFYRKCGYTHHATKHFSLIENLDGFAPVVNRYEFDHEFEKALNLFIFKYRAIYTDEKLHLYMYPEMKEKVISELVDL